jgi:hypothetical protein
MNMNDEIGKQITQVGYATLKKALVNGIKARLVTLVTGSPGIGKSALIQTVADHLNLKLIDKRLAEEDPTGIQGFPTIIDGRSSYAPPDWLPIEGDALPINPVSKQPYKGWLLFFDEFTSAAKAVQTATFKIIHDRKVGLKNIHKNVAIICAGNKETDNAFVEEMSTAMQSRLCHLELVMNTKDWLEYAEDAGYDYRVVSYLNWKPNELYHFDPNHTDKTFRCPRTWEMASRIMSKTEDDDPTRRILIAGVITQAAALQFDAYLQCYGNLPKMEDILRDPENTMVPVEISTLWALSSSLAVHAKPENIEALMKYINRIKKEFQFITHTWSGYDQAST